MTSPWTFVQLSLEALVKVTLKLNSNKNVFFVINIDIRFYKPYIYSLFSDQLKSEVRSAKDFPSSKNQI